jgi:hypothetical protein
MATVQITTAEPGWYIVHSNGSIADWRTFATKKAAEEEIRWRYNPDAFRAVFFKGEAQK